VALVDDGTDIDGRAAGTSIDSAAELDSAGLERDSIIVQLLHGPLLADGSFDEAKLSVLPMTEGDDGRFRASFVPDRAGRWGIAARAMPTHPNLRGPFDTGLVTLG
jgi:hypothetical protein